MFQKKMGTFLEEKKKSLDDSKHYGLQPESLVEELEHIVQIVFLLCMVWSFTETYIKTLALEGCMNTRAW